MSVVGPSPHPTLNSRKKFMDFFDLEPCLFCNRWYRAYDVVMASCKHFITKLVETKNCYVTCKEPFHPTWWTSFGFPLLQSDAQGDVAMTSLTKSMEDLSETFKDNFGLPILECKFLHLQHLSLYCSNMPFFVCCACMLGFCPCA